LPKCKGSYLPAVGAANVLVNIPYMQEPYAHAMVAKHLFMDRKSKIAETPLLKNPIIAEF
jgi:hypothetical protein